MSGRTYLFALCAIACVVILGSGLDVLEVDAAQYAGMSRDMLVHGDPLQPRFRGADYLDKPPLLFWLSALSFKLFGVHDVSYRLPSILFAFLGLFSTHRFTLLYYDRDIARSATLMFGGSVAFFLMTNDVRCDTILMGSVMTAIWLGCMWLETGRGWPLLGCTLAVAAGMLAKGPIGAMAPLLAVGGQLFHARRWVRLRDQRILLAALVLALALVPMCIGLHQQHGWHGIRFYFWEQSFGRITGENRWKDDSTVFFFTHEILWQLLPWTVLILLGLFRSVRDLIRGGLQEAASLAGAVLVFISLSFSHFKLPHYLYIILPLFAVMGARALHQGTGRGVVLVHRSMVILLWAAALALTWVVFPERRWPYLLILVLTAVVLLMVQRRSSASLTVVPAFWTMIAIGLVMNGYFYPGVLAYQANAKAGQWAWEHQVDQDHFFGMQVSGTALDYYAGYPVRWLSDANEARVVLGPGTVIYTDELRFQELLRAGLAPKERIELLNHPAQLISLPFLLPGERDRLLKRHYILRY